MDLKQAPNTSESDGENINILDIWKKSTGENITSNNFETSKSMPLAISEQIELYGTLVITPVGIVFNTVCLIVFYLCKTHKTATGLHLMCIAVADNFVSLGLIVDDAYYFADYVHFFNFLKPNLISCKAAMFFTPFGVLLSSLLVASATVERFISVAFALKVKMWNLLLASKIMLILYFVGTLLFSVMLGYYRQVESINYIPTCTFKVAYNNSLDVFFAFVFYGVALGFCSTVIIMFTFLIAVVLFKAKQQRKIMSQDNSDRNNNELRITLMLCTVAILFIVARFPMFTCYEIIIYYQNKLQFNNAAYLNAQIAYPVAALILTINHSINFIIYLIFFKKFRNTFGKFFKPCKSTKAKTDDVHDTVYTVQTNSLNQETITT